MVSEIPNSQIVSFRHFHGVNQQKLNASMNAHLSNVMLKSFESHSPSEWREDGLFELCYSLLFR